MEVPKKKTKKTKTEASGAAEKLGAAKTSGAAEKSGAAKTSGATGGAAERSGSVATDGTAELTRAAWAIARALIRPSSGCACICAFPTVLSI